MTEAYHELKQELLSQVVNGEREWEDTGKRYRSTDNRPGVLVGHCPASAVAISRAENDGDIREVVKDAYTRPTSCLMGWGLSEVEAKSVYQAAEKQDRMAGAQEDIRWDFHRFLDQLVRLSQLPADARVEAAADVPCKSWEGPIHA